MNKLIAYLLEHAVLDFTGELTVESVRDFLRDDSSTTARALIAKLAADRDLDDMMVTLADCLQEYIRTGVNEQVVLEQLQAYAES